MRFVYQLYGLTYDKVLIVDPEIPITSVRPCLVTECQARCDVKSSKILMKFTVFHRKKDNLYNLFRIFVPTISRDYKRMRIMRHRIKAGKVGSFTPEKQKVEEVQLEDREIIEDVENIFEEDTAFSNDDEALAAMEFYDSPEDLE